jgi:cephalosporin hydroxylase
MKLGFNDQHLDDSARSDIRMYMPLMKYIAAGSSFILEIGVDGGNGSTRAFSQGLQLRDSPRNLHISVDLNTNAPTIEKPSDSWWHMVHGDSADPATADRVAEICGDRKADVIFIDSLHTEEHMAKELEVWKRFSDCQTLWLFHDTWQDGSFGAVTPAITKFAAAEGYEFADFCQESHGFGLMRKKR